MQGDASLPQPNLITGAELAELVRGVRAGTATTIDAPLDLERKYNPFEVAARLKMEAAQSTPRKAAAAREALSKAAVASSDANAAVAELRNSRAGLELAEAESRSSTLVADTSGAVDRAAAKIDADSRLTEARKRYAEAVANEAEKSPLAFAVARAAREAEIAADEAPELTRQMARRVEPISIFVSRKEGHVFVRQGFEPVTESAITIKDSAVPLGTHVFTAIAPAADGQQLRWLAVTVPTALGDASGGAATAQAALARIELPERIRQELAKRTWTGASLVISDQGVSNETGKGTDFVILTK